MEASCWLEQTSTIIDYEVFLNFAVKKRMAAVTEFLQSCPSPPLVQLFPASFCFSCDGELRALPTQSYFRALQASLSPCSISVCCRFNSLQCFCELAPFSVTVLAELSPKPTGYCAQLWSPQYNRDWIYCRGASGGHEDDEGSGVSLIRGESAGAGTVQSREEKTERELINACKYLKGVKAEVPASLWWCPATGRGAADTN